MVWDEQGEEQDMWVEKVPLRWVRPAVVWSASMHGGLCLCCSDSCWLASPRMKSAELAPQ